jgi:hypothetical protein
MYKHISMQNAASAAGYRGEKDAEAKDAVCSTGTAGVEGVGVPCGSRARVDDAELVEDVCVVEVQDKVAELEDVFA